MFTKPDMGFTRNLTILAISLTFFLLPHRCFGETSLINALKSPKTVTQPIPFKGTMDAKFSPAYSFPIQNDNHEIPDKLYKNVQLSEFDWVGDDDEVGPVLFRKFTIPNSSNLLAVVNFGGATYLRTDILCVVNPAGKTITTAQATSLPFSTFTSFIGQRKDIYYTINAQGQFVQQSEVLFKPKTYTKTGFKNLKNIWEGGEVPI